MSLVDHRNTSHFPNINAKQKEMLAGELYAHLVFVVCNCSSTNDENVTSIANSSCRLQIIPSSTHMVLISAPAAGSTAGVLPTADMTQPGERAPRESVFQLGDFPCHSPQLRAQHMLCRSTLMGAQINQGDFNSSGAWAAFGPWEQSTGATFFPSVFSLRSAPSLTSTGSSIMMDHFIAFVNGATTPLDVPAG